VSDLPKAVLLTPYVTEKSMNAISGTPVQSNKDGNRIEFIVRRDSTKKEIKEAFEKKYEVKVEFVNTRIMNDGKHAVIKLKPGFSAEEVGMRIGIF
jgi:large subunit ribosomal protein L23